ncbi:anti-anti-sigma factor [Spirilliplanes yamanashiensis]|uniref:Anti-anti-sigma factor n=1 Tax=Spirilliplanes yamanashiensis TaxID=42233 RepID=A0A8J4DKT3_9ACTN|nr:anti-anti-sigma factor [Spirilliplanes yamanashiensis]
MAVLRVTGDLDTATAPALRTALHTALAAQPDAVVVDIAGLDVRHPTALDVFPAMTAEAADWPAVPLMLHSPGDRTARQLADTGCRVHPTLEHALDEVRSTAAPVRLRARLRPTTGACRQARELVADACERWGLAELRATAAVVVTELVANVIRHARTGMEITLAPRDGRLSIAVRDGSAREPEPADPGLDEAGGRGLRLVRDLSDAWGVLPVVDGKVVWATIGS